jgi:hypothetical protein
MERDQPHVYCADSTMSTNYEYLDAEGNLILASGTYTLGTIDAVDILNSELSGRPGFKLHTGIIESEFGPKLVLVSA